MKIAINASILDEKPTGLGVYTINVIRELSNLLDDDDIIDVYTSSTSHFKTIKANIKRIPRCVQPRYNKLGGLMRFFWNQFIFPIKIIKEDYDIVYCTTHHGSLFLKNQFITIHDLIAMQFPQQHRFQWFYFRIFMPLLIKRNKIITISNNTKKDICKYYKIDKDKIYIVYNGVQYNKNLDRTVINVFEKYKLKNYILCVGASYEHKNLERLIKAYYIIAEKISEELLIVGGRNKYLDKLKIIIEERDLTERVKILNYVTNDDLPYLYANARVFVYPSLYEGFGLPPLEAMAYNCPVIVSKTSSLPEVCGNAAYYIDPECVDSIANGIYEVLNNEQLRERLIKFGRERISNFSWNLTAINLMKIFTEKIKNESIGHYTNS